MTDNFNCSSVSDRRSVAELETVTEKLLLLISEIGMLPRDTFNSKSHLRDNLGFDSMMLAELKKGIATSFPTIEDLPLSLLFNANIEEIINFISTSVKDASPNLVTDKSSLSDFSVAYTQFQIWKSDFQPDKLIRLEKYLVHKEKEQNVLLTRVEKLQDDFIIGEVVQDIHHPFFYEHYQDHVPGLYLIEAARQFGTALSHLYYEVPIDMPFILDEIQARFYRFAEVDLPLFLVARNRDKVYIKEKLWQMYSNVTIVQEEEVIAEIGGFFKIFELNSYNNVRKKITIKS